MAAFERRAGGFTRKTGLSTTKRGGFTRAKLPENPLDTMVYTGNPEKDALKQTELTLEALQNKERKKALREKLRVTTDSEFWCALCFETREQKDAFLQGVGVYEDGDKYIDGAAFARRLGIQLPEATIDYRPAARPNKRLQQLVKD